ncbi:MAG: inositol monophosphatase family protein [Candidatus Shapirobacteria bacterium]
MDIKNIQKKLEKIVLSYGKLALDSQESNSIIRYSPNICTDIDVKIEQQFSEWVSHNFPDYSLIMEESSDLKDSRYTWVLDAIDGSKYYIKGVPLWTVTAALLEDGQPIIGVVYQPQSKMLFSASKNNGAFLNGKKIICQHNLQDSENEQISVDLTFGSKNYKQYAGYVSTLLDELHQKFYRVRSFGCGSLSLCWLSVGMFSAYMAPLLKPEKYIDIAAGLLIATESGLRVQKKPNKQFPEVTTILVDLR